MQYRTYNQQYGEWGQKFNVFLYFIAFLTLSFMFSILTFLFVEAPLANVLNEFFKARTEEEKR